MMSDVSCLSLFHNGSLRRTLYICDGNKCRRKICRHLADKMIETLGIGFNQRTADGLVSLKLLWCSGHANSAPIDMVNEDRFEITELSDLDWILAEVVDTMV